MNKWTVVKQPRLKHQISLCSETEGTLSLSRPLGRVCNSTYSEPRHRVRVVGCTRRSPACVGVRAADLEALEQRPNRH